MGDLHARAEETLPGLSPDEIDLAEMPGWMIEVLR
jgi:hypothetical protein